MNICLDKSRTVELCIVEDSFTQLALFARCTLGHHVRVLDMLLRPLHGAAGLGWKDHEVKKPPTPQRPRTEEEGVARDDKLLAKIAWSPFGFRSVQVSDPGDASGNTPEG